MDGFKLHPGGFSEEPGSSNSRFHTLNSQESRNIPESTRSSNGMGKDPESETG